MTDNVGIPPTLISEILQGVEQRKQNYKYDAYFDLPEDITIEEIKQVQHIIQNHQLGCRLYDRHRLQVYWDSRPRRNTIEFLSGISALHDIDEQIELFRFGLQRGTKN